MIIFGVTVSLTGTIEGFSIGSGPGESRRGDSNSATAEQDVVAYQAANLSHGCVDPWYLTPLYLHIHKEHTRKALRLRTTQMSVDEGGCGGQRLLELNQLKQATVALPRVIVKAWGMKISFQSKLILMQNAEESEK